MPASGKFHESNPAIYKLLSSDSENNKMWLLQNMIICTESHKGNTKSILKNQITEQKFKNQTERNSIKIIEKKIKKQQY